MIWLSELATRDDKVGAVARDELAKSLRSLIPDGFIDLAEMAVLQVSSTIPQWTEALESLGRVMTHPRANLAANVVDRVAKLITALLPKDLMDRVRFLVTRMPWDYPYEPAPDYETKYPRKVEAVRGLIRELVEHPVVLRGVLPDLCRGRQRMAHVFGEVLVDTVETPDGWLDRVLGAVAEAPDNTRDYDLLAGYLAGLAKRAPHLLATAKECVARSSELAPALPRIFQVLGAAHEIGASDVALVIDAVKEGRLSPLGFGQGFFGAVLRPVPTGVARPLFEVLIDHSAAAFSEAVQMISTYVYGTTGKLEELRPQVRRIAENVSRWNAIPEVAMVRGCFDEIMNWMLRKGREERDACATALALARALATMKAYDHSDLLTPIVPLLLSGFPEIVWPLLGQALVSDEARNRPLESILMSPDDNKHESVLLKLSEDTLFAWCHAHPVRAPVIAARCLPILRNGSDATARNEMHPTMARLLDEFGDRAGVLPEVELNMGNFSVGSASDHLALYHGPLTALCEHPIPTVRAWATRMLRDHGAVITELRKHDDESAVMAEFA